MNANNCPPRHFVLVEYDGPDVWFHGCVRVPNDKTDADVLRIYAAVMESKEDWTYEDILSALKAEGFEKINAELFWEHYV